MQTYLLNKHVSHTIGQSKLFEYVQPHNQQRAAECDFGLLQSNSQSLTAKSYFQSMEVVSFQYCAPW